MSKIGVFYGSTTGTTEDVARKIAEKLNVPQGDIHDASTLTDALVKEYDVLVLGTSTWGAGELQDDWYDGVKVLKRQIFPINSLLCSAAVIPTHTATHFVTASVFCMKI